MRYGKGRFTTMIMPIEEKFPRRETAKFIWGRHYYMVQALGELDPSLGVEQNYFFYLSERLMYRSAEEDFD